MKFFNIKKGKFKIGIRKKSNKNIFYFIIVILFFLVLNLFGQNYLRNIFHSITAPIQNVFWNAGQAITEWTQIIKEFRTLKRDKQDLLKQNQILIGENIRLQKLRQENIYLRQAMEMAKEQEFELILARVIAKNVVQDELLINKGKRDGISINMPVVTSEKVLVGKINKVYQDFSRVMLVSNNESIFDVWVHISDNAQKIKGIIKGGGQGQSFLEFIPIDKKLRIGDIVSTSLLGGIFPQGLFVGTIKSITKDDIAAFQRAEISLAFDITKLDFLFIITN